MPLHRRAALPAISMVIAVVTVAGPQVVARMAVDAPPPAAVLAAPTRGPDVAPLLRGAAPEAAPRKVGGNRAAGTTSSTPPPAPSCADYRDGAAAQAALETGPDLAVHLDTDRDGQACERRFPPRATSRPQPATATGSARQRGPPPGPPAVACPSELAGTRPHVAHAGHHLARRFGVPIGSIGGRSGRARPGSDHPSGLALDFLVGRETGDDLAAYALDRRDTLGITYVIWRQRINHGSGWEPMADRGGVTANHMDHVHVSFSPSGGAGLPC